MKLLRLTMEGHPLFCRELDLSFYATQRMTPRDKKRLNYLFTCGTSEIYLNTANAFVGINASGKTTILEIIAFAINLLNGKSINGLYARALKGADRIVLNLYYLSNTNNICHLATTITAENGIGGKKTYKIVKENLWKKSINEVLTKKLLLNFENLTPERIRNSEELYLPADISIMIAEIKQSHDEINFFDLLFFTDNNFYPFLTSNFVTPEILEFLDPSVKSFHIKQTEKNVNIRLEFKNGRKYTINDLSDLNLYLSSGTIKGMMVYSVASLILKNGGCLMVDEIENHFNKELVLTLIRFFMDNTVNTGGGVLFFSTHYAELLDEFERNDSIYFARNGNGIDIRSLNADLKRNDLKKSEVYQSGYTGGTTPDYEAYLKLKKSFQRRSATK